MINPFHKKILSLLSVILVLVITALACSAPIGNRGVVTVVVTQVVTVTPQATLDVSPTIEQATPTQEPSATTEPPTATPTVTHVNRPGSFVSGGPYMWDSDSSVTASQNRPQGGEYFDNNLYERPFNAGAQDKYFPQIDIVKSSMLNGNPWVYGSVTLKSVSPDNGQLDATYALELDINRDGRGDYLILVNKPAVNDWSTDGVQVWFDSNYDVGGNTPVRSDPPQRGNGYDQLLFDQGQGNDPDLAWARVSADKPNEVWFAFKPVLIKNAQQFMWGAWAQTGGMHPDWLDYNDHFNHNQAGSPLPGVSQYPLKDLAEVDNSCRWAVGFSATGSEPGICPLPPTPTPVPPTATPKPLIQLTLIIVYPLVTPTPTTYIIY
ncbi:MAG: hypothetical protein LWX83_00205 [Anaerolineae bacterium]|nr:hypothetical protein [Anaerolineae bacterium]